MSPKGEIPAQRAKRRCDQARRRTGESLPWARWSLHGQFWIRTRHLPGTLEDPQRPCVSPIAHSVDRSNLDTSRSSFAHGGPSQDPVSHSRTTTRFRAKALLRCLYAISAIRAEFPDRPLAAAVL